MPSTLTVATRSFSAAASSIASFSSSPCSACALPRGTGVTASAAHSNQRLAKQHSVRVSAHQLAREIRTFQARGYVPTACTVDGTLMRNYTTGQSVTVAW
jgi:hypothetical protein